MKVETKKWIVLADGEPMVGWNGVVGEWTSKSIALEFARELLKEKPDRSMTVQEWTKTEEVEVH